MTRDEILAHQQRERELLETPVGKAMRRLENAAFQNGEMTQIKGFELMKKEADSAQKEAWDQLALLVRPLLGLDP